MRTRRSFFKRATLGRRAFLKLGAMTGLGAYLFSKCGFVGRAEAVPLPGGTLNPTTIPKYAMPLVVPPAMPRTSRITRQGTPIDYYEIAVRQFEQQILPTSLPATTVWSYGSINHPGTFNYPAFTIEAKYRVPVRVKWINELVDENGDFLPHLLPVDPTLHWANPPGGTEDRDTRSTFLSTPGRYTGPVPIVTHLHGGRTAQESDGFAEAWFLPAANNISPEFATEGSHYEFFRNEFLAKWDVGWEPGTATFQYHNTQRAATLWYHDHTLGMTRLNVYAGPAGFYLLRRGPGDLPAGALPGPSPDVGADPFGRFYEIPLALQDRSFNSDGSLFYPDSRVFFDGFEGPYIPDSDVPPIWNPEFFGNTMVVNGRTWPFLDTEPRHYRFRILNGCNSRFLILKIVTDPLAPRPASLALPFWQIGGEGGFLQEPVMREELLIAPAERADVIVDFTGLTVGTELFLINEGPDEPFGGGETETDFEAADPRTTGQVMRFTIVPLASHDSSLDPALANFKLPAVIPLGPATNTRQVSLNEQGSAVFDGPVAALLGTLDPSGNAVQLGWADPITENPARNSIELWELYNFTEDAHPIHIHEVGFEVVDRQPFDGVARPAEPWETGRKDTVIAYPGEITRVKALFDLAGLYVWHCHIVEHEDNEMMRPYFIGPLPQAVVQGSSAG
jgi:FtsP/CotA-like multicopper oxidase with cupredoxin domain